MGTPQVDTSDMTDNTDPRSGSAGDVILARTSVLDQAVRALADAGEPVPASRFAAQAWSSLRTTHPEHAERLNRAMHYLARREAVLEGKTAR